MASHHHAAAEVSCPACDFGPFLRNSYWTGKLLLAGDFIAEQRYFMEKLRHHNLHLHGSGVVCGLKVVEHEKEECQQRFVCVEPGTAVDCCGHEIVLRFKECIDLSSIPALQELKEKKDKDKHVLAICIRYRECETEHVPVLYDECGCADDKCAPNRVLEAFALDVMVDPKLPEPQKFPDKCGDLWSTSIDGCKHCDQPDCVILATITDYVVDSKIKNPASLPPPAGSIDNFTHRDILPSAELLQSVIKCVMEKGIGGGGGVGPAGPAGKGIDEVKATFVDCKTPGTAKIDESGPKRTLVLEVPKGCDGAPGGGGVGPAGPAGKGIDEVKATFVDCKTPGKATIDESGPKRTLVLQVPTGCDGKDGVGLQSDLTQIDALSWHHGAGSPINPPRDPMPVIVMMNGAKRTGFVVHFTKKVDIRTLDADHVFQVLIEHGANDEAGLRCRCPLAGEVKAVTVTKKNDKFITEAQEIAPNQTDAVAFLLPDGFPDPGKVPAALAKVITSNRPEFWVVLHCDFILDENHRAVDGEFVRFELPTGDRPGLSEPGSNLGIQGGTFESWFQFKPAG